MKLPSWWSSSQDLMSDPLISIRLEMEDMFRRFDRHLPSLRVGAGTPAIHVADQASDRRGAAIVDAVRGLRHARRERDTWCGSSTDRRPGRAGWRRLRLEPNQQTAAPSTGRVRLGALSRQAPASALAAGAQPQAAVSGRPGGDEGWRATAPALCRRRRSSRWPGARAATASIKTRRRSPLGGAPQLS